jgi:hypothetical protein
MSGDLLRKLAQAAQKSAAAGSRMGGSGGAGGGFGGSGPTGAMGRGIAGVLVGTTALAFGAYHSLYTVEGGHRAVMYNRFVGVKVIPSHRHIDT